MAATYELSAQVDRGVEFASAPQPSQRAVGKACLALLGLQHRQGYWLFELEADTTIPAEYVLMMHHLGQVDISLQTKMAVYLRDRQLADGGWSLYPGAEADLSCSVKSYYALKLAGDRPEAGHMRRARQTILRLGGASKANVLTRVTLALFGQLPWRAVPHLPVETLLLPKWLPLNLRHVSYWSRTVMVPLLVLCTLKPQACNPNRLGIGELFAAPPETVGNFFASRSALNRFFLAADRFGRYLDKAIPKSLRRRALGLAERWMVTRINAESGLGGIFPATVNALMALDALGYCHDEVPVADCRQALDRLVVEDSESAYCQPCLSPVWDSIWCIVALQEARDARATDALRNSLDWLAQRQLGEEPGDWRGKRPRLEGGGWAFQFLNSHYPDLDDSAVAALALLRSGDPIHAPAIHRAARWICGMQSLNGGFGAFDADCDKAFLNEIPFADHGALLDPPTADISARCASLLAKLAGADRRYQTHLDECLRYLSQEQEDSGAWFGRWGCNFIYGTWSALTALSDAGVAPGDPRVRRGADWLETRQNPDGGWGETNASYCDANLAGKGPSTSFQTAWALLGIMAAGRTQTQLVRRGVDYLVRTQHQDGFWHEPWFTAAGFPRVFYLKYHGYSVYFPLLALARYRKLAEQRRP